MSVSEIYEKMLQNPRNRKSSSGEIKQPTPFDGGGKLPSNVKENIDKSVDISAEEMAFLNAVDQRIAHKKANNEEIGKKEPSNPSGRLVEEIKSLKSRVKELEELVTVMMKQQMKLMNED
jgi:hypothetical protein